MNETKLPASSAPDPTDEDRREASPATKLYVRLLVLAACIAAVGAILFFWRSNGKVQARSSASASTVPDVVVHVAAARTGDVQRLLDALGTVTAVSTVNVYSQATGPILAVHYREGQMVRKGDPLLDIDPRPYRAQLEQVQGTLDQDRAYLRQTQIDLTRYREAYAEHAVAKQILDDQEQALAQYAGAVRNDEGQVAYASVQLGYCHIVAPTSGRVGLRLVDRGNTVFSGGSTPLLTITTIQPMSVIFNVPEDRLGAVREQIARRRTLTVQALDREAQHTLAVGYLHALDNEIDTSTGTLRLRAEFANSGLQLYPNQFVTARLLLETLHGVTMISHRRHSARRQAGVRLCVARPCGPAAPGDGTCHCGPGSGCHGREGWRAGGALELRPAPARNFGARGRWRGN